MRSFVASCVLWLCELVDTSAVTCTLAAVTVMKTREGSTAAASAIVAAIRTRLAALNMATSPDAVKTMRTDVCCTGDGGVGDGTDGGSDGSGGGGSGDGGGGGGS